MEKEYLCGCKANGPGELPDYCSEHPDLGGVLLEGIEMMESSLGHISHGGPTRADAERWIKKARGTLIAADKQWARKQPHNAG